MNPDTQHMPCAAGAITSPTAVSDMEIVATLFQLALSGRFLAVGPLLVEAQGIYPNESAERLEACLKRLGGILIREDYQGLNSEYRRTRLPRKGTRNALKELHQG